MKNNTLIFFAMGFLTIAHAQNINPSQGQRPVNLSSEGFYENKGQIVDQSYAPNPGVKYLLCSPGFNVQIRQTGFSYDTYTDTPYETKISAGLSHSKIALPKSYVRHYHRVDIELQGCNPHAAITTEGKSKAYYNYFTAGTPQGGVSDVHAYQKVTYTNIYPHIDLVFYAASKSNPQPEYNFIVHPGGNPADIKLAYKGANKISLTDNKLTVNVIPGNFTENIPSSYIKDNMQPVLVNYTALGNNVFTFSLNPEIIKSLSSDLIIDPLPDLAWATYYGGHIAENGIGIAVDASENVYITGAASSIDDIATAGVYQVSDSGNGDAFVAKFNPTGTTLIWGTYYGGKQEDFGAGIALDASDNVYVTGGTDSPFMATPGAYQPAYVGSWLDAFVAKFNPTGTTRLWSTYYGDGGTGNCFPYAIALGEGDSVYITGWTHSVDSIATPGAYQINNNSPGGGNAYVAKFDPTGSTLLWGTYFGGTQGEQACAIAVDANDNAYITGSAQSTANVATPGAYQPALAGFVNAFAAKFNPSGSTLLWGTYYGGTQIDAAYGIALDESDNVYIAGYASSNSGIATPGSYRPTYAGTGLTSDAFVAKLNSTGTSRIWGTYYAGANATNDAATGIAVGLCDNVFITGLTTSTDSIATPGAYQTTLLGTQYDAFVARFDPTGSTLVWGTYFGQNIQNNGYVGGIVTAIALDALNNVYITGTTSGDSIATDSAWQQKLNSPPNAFVAKFDSSSLILASSQSNLLCNGVNTGTATVIASNGSPPYTYSWSNTLTTSSISGLSAGSYTCTVSDKSGCTLTSGITLTQPTAITASATPTDACGANNGSATVAASGGTGAYHYNWTPSGGTGITASGLSAGTYTCTVTDVNGCSQTTTATIISIGTGPTATPAQTNLSCNGVNTGAATITASGGTAPYTYTWTSGQTSSSISALSAGSYTCTVTDNKGCAGTANVSITQPPAITATATPTNATCGNIDGKAKVVAGGGTGAYTYSWTPSGSNVDSISGLSAGTYTCTVTDANGCSKTVTALISSIAGPTVVPTPINLLCNGVNLGAAIVTASSGTVPYTYSWNSGQTTSGISSLSAGTYSCVVTDKNGCTQTTSVSITQPPIVTASASATNAACAASNGSATVTAGGGTGALTYSWAPSGGSGATAGGLSAGTYTCTVTDANGCSQTTTATVGRNSGGLSLASAENNPLCKNDGAIATITPSSGAPPYTYSWSNGQTTSSISGLSSGTYTCEVTDANGCSQTTTVIVSPTTGPAIHISPDVSINSGDTTVLSATGGDTYQWIPATGLNCISCTNPKAFPTQTTSYCVWVKDTTSGCMDSACVTVTVEPPCGGVFVPNVFTPDYAGPDDKFYIKTDVFGTWSIIIYDRWGKEMYNSTNPSQAWNGNTETGAKALDGVYYYIIKAICLDGKTFDKHGYLQLIR